MEKEFDIIFKSDKVETPILRNLIKIYGIKSIFNNKKIIKNNMFYILFISMQDYDLYKQIGNIYKLFIYNFINYCNDSIVRNYLYKIINIDNYPNIDDYHILKLWEYVYDSEISNLKDEYIYSIDIKKILNAKTNLKKYDYNIVTKLLIFTWHSKYDLAITILKNISDEIEIDRNEILNFLNKEISIFSYTNLNPGYYPLFESSNDTKTALLNIPEIVISSLDPGYIWKTPEYFKKLISNDTCDNIIDIFFSYLYNSLINGIVTHNLLIWTYLFGYSYIEPILLSKLFSLVNNIPMSVVGVVSDLLIAKNLLAVDKIKDDSNTLYTNYMQGQKEFDINNILASYPVNILKYIAQKPFEPTGYFYNFGIDLDKYKFNNNFFNILISTNPLSKSIFDINDKIKIFNGNEIYNDYYIKIYNTINLIKSNGNSFEIIKQYNFTIIDNITESDLIYFDHSIIKKEILNILFNKYSFIPLNEKNLREQYINFIIKKSFPYNLYKTLINSDIEKKIKDIIDKDINLMAIFRKPFNG
ncbi:core protein [Alphaentomopoxvirus acuprea]|uniref:Core protein n=1 Tax=Alphaentomopoxvirus acuprea TaxID=62099 RepID=W6JIV5_9POXV|nr:core protein [Anomala cuprea entomopoxvirus]BAO49523.1 core protein [Anomala cuprea entomopoxvirus]